MNKIIDKLRERLGKELPGREAQLKMAPSVMHEADDSNAVKSSVLILIYPKNNSLYIVLIKRPEYNGHHSGQISFPGGKCEPSDKCYEDTALRETFEEIGIIREDIQVLGQITSIYIPPSNFKIYPIVGYLSYTPTFNINSTEVERTIEIKMADLTDKSIIKIKEVKTSTGQYINAPYYSIEDEVIWGATAMILAEFITIIAIDTTI